MPPSFFSVLGWGALGALFLLVAHRNGFFTFPEGSKEWKSPPITLSILFLPFALYFFVQFGVVAIANPIIRQIVTVRIVSALSWLNFFIHFVLLGGLALLLRYLPSDISRSLLLRRPVFFPKSDLLLGAAAYVIALPLVGFANDLSNLILYWVYGPVPLPDQLAVQFLKMTMGQPIYFFLTSITIVLFAPCIEECLFRGFLQSYLRKALGPTSALLITALCFSFFHFTLSQGVSNLPIIASLFVLALFLGFIYERQGSLLASITLHALFNLFSVVDLALFG